MPKYSFGRDSEHRLFSTATLCKIAHVFWPQDGYIIPADLFGDEIVTQQSDCQIKLTLPISNTPSTKD